MQKLRLPRVTLVAISGIGYQTQENIEALKRSCEGIEWGAVEYLQLSSIRDIDTWNRAVIYDLPKYIHTDFAMLVHGDGYVENPFLWSDDFLLFDYTGAPWPLPKDSYSYRDANGQLVRVGNSVSLRSKRLMDLAATIPEKDFWAVKDRYGNTNEDGFICCHYRNWLEEKGCTFAPVEVARHFSKEHQIPENVGLKTFAFHKVDL